MVMAPVRRESLSQPSVSLLTVYEEASPYATFHGVRSDSQLLESANYLNGASSKAACRRHSRHSAGGKEGEYANNSGNLGTIVYSVCCICQFVSYLPLLVLRVCFGSQQQSQKQLVSHHRQPSPQPGMRTLAGLLLIGLPLMVLASLPVVGRFVSFVTSPPSRESRARTASMSSLSSCSRRSCSMCSDT